MYDPFKDIIGQDGAVKLLKKSLDLGQVGHAYLFAGGRSSGRMTTALAFAKALLCQEGGCGDCKCCQRVDRLIHPDVHVIDAQGQKIAIDQIRAVISESQMVPVEGASRVVIFANAQDFGTEAANAFLRTLEEPPPGNVFILIAPDESALLDTIASRCQLVRFLKLSPDSVRQVLFKTLDMQDEDIDRLGRQAGWSLAKSIESANQKHYGAKRDAVFDLLSMYPIREDLALKTADVLRGMISKEIAELKAAHKQEMEDALKLYGEARGGQGVKKLMEARHKREEKSARAEGLRQVFAIIQGWYRDELAVKSDAPGEVLNADRLDDLSGSAARHDPSAIAGAIKAIQEMDDIMSYNVSEQFALDNLLLKLGGL